MKEVIIALISIYTKIVLHFCKPINEDVYIYIYIYIYAEKKQAFTYTCLFFKWEPQLIPILPWGRDDLADLTPDIITILGWLGIENRETICGAFHGLFINSVEQVLKVLVTAVPNVGRWRERAPERLLGGDGGGGGLIGDGQNKRSERGER